MSDQKGNLMVLLEPVLTVTEADDLLERLETARQGLHREGGAQALKNNLTVVEFEGLNKYLQMEGIQVEAALERWEEGAGQTKILQLKLSFSPTQGFLEELKTYFTKKWEEQIPFRLKIETDNRLVGGVTVGWEGRVYDKSWGEKIRKEIVRISKDYERGE